MKIARVVLTVLIFSATVLRLSAVSKQLAELTASDGSYTADFGVSVAASDNTVVVGAPYTTVGQNTNEGAAYVFVKPTSGWSNMTQVAKLTPSNGRPNQLFGSSVAISGDTIVVSGYVFVKPKTGWRHMTETARLVAGLCAIDGDTIVYSDGSVFVKPKTGWATGLTPVAKLSEAKPVNDGFGASVAISGNTVVIGAATLGGAPGAGYVFMKPLSGWTNMTETAKLTQTDRTAEDYFGLSVGINGSSIVVGAPYKESVGAAYIFVEQPSGWADMTQTAEFTVASPNADNQLGFSVAVAGNKVIVGRPFNCNNANEGAADVYKKPTNGWVTTSHFSNELLPSDPQIGNSFAISVAASGGRIFVGASKLEQARGVVYVY